MNLLKLLGIPEKIEIPLGKKLFISFNLPTTKKYNDVLDFNLYPDKYISLKGYRGNFRIIERDTSFGGTYYITLIREKDAPIRRIGGSVPKLKTFNIRS